MLRTARSDTAPRRGLVVRLAQRIAHARAERVAQLARVAVVAHRPALAHEPRLEAPAALRSGGAERVRGGRRAVAVVADARTADSDAVRVELEHREGTCLFVLQPYSRSRLRKKVTFGAMSVSVGERHTWA